MWGWIVAVVVAAVSSAVVYYLRPRSQDALTELMTENRATLQTVNSLLVSLAKRASEANKADQDEATNVETSKEASDFLNASGSPGLPSKNSNTRVSASACLCTPRRSPAARVVCGFARGPGYVTQGPDHSPGAVDSSRESVARNGACVSEGWG